MLVDDLLRGAGLRENVKVICSGKVCTPTELLSCRNGLVSATLVMGGAEHTAAAQVEWELRRSLRRAMLLV